MLWMTTNIGFRRDCSTPSTMFIRHYTKWFPSFSFSTKCSEWQKILYLGWSVLPHQPYSSDLIPSDFHLFPSLQNALNDNKYWIKAGLFYPIKHINPTLYQVISIFFILYKMLWMTTNIGFRLVCSTPSTIFIRPYTKWFPSSSFSTKCSEWQQILDLGWSVLTPSTIFIRPYTKWFPSFSFSTKCSEWQQILDLRWSVLPHLPYSSDLIPCDFHLFHSLQNSSEWQQILDLGWFCSIPSTIFIRPYTKWFPSFSFSTKYSEWQQILD